MAERLIVAPTRGDVVDDLGRPMLIESVQTFAPDSNTWMVTIRDRGRRVKYKRRGESYVWVTCDG